MVEYLHCPEMLKERFSMLSGYGYVLLSGQSENACGLLVVKTKVYLMVHDKMQDWNWDKRDWLDRLDLESNTTWKESL